MSFNTDWDVDAYRTEHECEEHWQLRRSFMLAHKDKFPEDRLVCLAAVFTNVELLGCRYPGETMELVARLSEGVADEFRERQKSKLQRTFVKASDAAGAKVKGLKRPASVDAGPSDVPAKCTKSGGSSVSTRVSFVPSVDSSPKNPLAMVPEGVKSSPDLTHEETKVSSSAVEAGKLLSSTEKRLEHGDFQREDDRDNRFNHGDGDRIDPSKRLSGQGDCVLDDGKKARVGDQRDIRGSEQKVCQPDYRWENRLDKGKVLGPDGRQEIKYDDLKEMWSDSQRGNSCNDRQKVASEGRGDTKDSESGEQRSDLEAVRKNSGLNGCDVGTSDTKSTKSGNESDSISETLVPVAKISKKTRKLKGGGRDQILEAIDAGKFGRLVLLEDDVTTYPGQIIARSAACCQIPLVFEYEDSAILPSVLCRVLVNDQEVAVAEESCKKDAREAASKLALEKLKDICYTLKVKEKNPPQDVIVDRAMVAAIDTSKKSSTAPIPTASALATPLPENNIGSKLMRSMGWTGGGLGKDHQGIQEPVSVSLRVNRAGLGLQELRNNEFKAKFRQLASGHFSRDIPHNMIVKAEFSAVEKEIMEKVCRQLKLQVKIVGKGDDEQLIISKKDTLIPLVARMLRNRVYSDECYDLEKPRKRASEPTAVIDSSIYSMQVLKSEAARNANIRKQKSAVMRAVDMEDKVNKLGQPVSKAAARRAARKAKNERKKERRQLRKVGRTDLNSIKVTSRAERLKEVKAKADLLNSANVIAGPFGNFFLVEHKNHNPIQIFLHSVRASSATLTYEYGSFKTGVFCKVFLNRQLLSSACGNTKKEARRVAVELGYQKLRQISYILKVKKAFLSENDSVLDRALKSMGEGGLGGGPSSSQGASLDTPMGEGIGSKLMRSMGWAGGGLGKEEQGVQEPVRLSQQVNRSGLGLPKAGSDVNRFRAEINQMLRDYAARDTLYDLVFASDFTSDERAMMHQIANLKGLKSKSYGKGESRHLVISKKKDFVDIVVSMIQNGEYSSERYELLEPSGGSFSPVHQPLSESNNALLVGAANQRKKAASQKAQLQAELRDLVEDAEVPVASVLETHCRHLEVHRIENENNSSISFRGLHAGPYGRLVLVEEEGCTTPTQIIERSANGCHIPFKYEYESVRNGMLCRLYVNNTLVVSATDCSKKRAREFAVDAGVDRLRDLCYTLKTHMKVDGMSLKVIRRLSEPRNRGSSNSRSGLGRDIICVSKLIDQSCLGIKSFAGVHPSVITREIQDILVDYMRETCPYDIVIPPDFLASDKMSVQKMASRYGLKTNFYKVSYKDFLVVSKKLPIQEMAEALLRSGGNTNVDPMQER